MDLETVNTIQLKIGVQPRDHRFPPDDDQLAQSLTTMVYNAVIKGVPPPTLLVLKTDSVDFIDLRPLLDINHPIDHFIASASGQDGVEAVALLAVMNMKDGDRPVGRAGGVFIEWKDNRWFQSYYLLGESNRPLEDYPPVIRKAVDGMPKPSGLGSWFSRGRFHNLKLRLERSDPDPVVH